MNRSLNDASTSPAFAPLAPAAANAEEMQRYAPEFDLVFSRADVRNIAVTGAQASSKTAVVNGWKATHQPERWMTVSLPRFNRSESQVSETAAEDALINQVVCQMDLAKSPKTRFRSMMARNRRLDVVLALVAAAFVALTLFLVWIAGLLPSSRPAPVLCALALIAWLGCIGFGVFHIARTDAIGRLLERFKLRNADIELSTGQDDSHLERYMADLVYLLNTNDYDNVVFEGLDTYRSLPLFERLRALNALANTQRTGGQRPALRFFYLVGDGLFDDPHDRAQFFDYIIPVIPYADPSNSLMLFKEGLAGLGVAVDEDFLYNLSHFVDDPSILRDIVNETRHYQDGLLNEESTEEDTEQLIALLTYKALFPRDFEMLQAGKGYVNALLKSRPAIAEQLQARGGDQDYSRLSLARLLAEMPHAKPLFQNPPYAEGLDDDYLQGVLASPYFPYLQFALSQGLIDGSYERFMTNFYTESLTGADRGLIAALAQERAVDCNRAVDNPFAVASRMEADGIAWENVRVYALLSHLIAYGPSSRLQTLLNGVENDGDLHWLLDYTESDQRNNAVYACIEQFLDQPIARLLADEGVDYARRKRFCHGVLAYGGSVLDVASTHQAVRDFALADPAFLQVEGVQPMRIARGLAAIDYKPENLETAGCDMQLLQFAYDHDLYAPVAGAIDNLVASLLEIQPALPDGSLVSRIHTLDDTAVKHLVESNADTFLESVLANVPLTGLHDTPEAIAWMLGLSGVSPQHGLGYIKALSDTVSIDDLGTIGSYTYQGVLLDRNLVECTPTNILSYFTSAGNIVDEHLAALLEANPFPAGFTMATTEEVLGSEAGFLKAIIECEELSDEKVGEITTAYRAQFNHFDIPGVSEDRMKVLISNGVVRMTADNLTWVRANCPGASHYFARADIDEYINLVNPTAEGEIPAAGFVRNEALDIFERDDVDDAYKVALLAGFSEAVSMSPSYSNELNAAIASRHFNANDLPLVDDLYEQGNRKLKRALAEAIVEHRDAVAAQNLHLSMEMVADIAWRLRDNRAGMLGFIAQQLTGRDPEPSRLEVRVVFERANLREYAALIDGPSALIPVSTEDDTLLEALGALNMAGKQSGKPDWQNRRRVNSKGYSRK